jgi:3-keto-5-aminohexanoate cleavage enzyme
VTTAFNQFAKNRVMIISAPNGARRTHADHPALPITPEELAESAMKLRDVGASVLHLHVRDEQGGHTLDAERYRQAMSAIRERVGDDLIVQVTTEAVGMYTATEQMALVRDLKPEAVSLALRELCPNKAQEETAAGFFAWMRRERIWPQYILYSVDDLKRFDDMRQRGVFSDATPLTLLVLGNYSQGIAGTVSDLELQLSGVDCHEFPWAACCFGEYEHAVMMAAEARGGHVRIGFENNLAMADGSLAPDNAALIRQFTAVAESGIRRPATAAEVRATFCDAIQ